MNKLKTMNKESIATIVGLTLQGFYLLDMIENFIILGFWNVI